MKHVVDNGDGTAVAIGVEDGKVFAGTQQEVGPIVDSAKRMQAEGVIGSSEMRLAARVPFVEVELYLRDHGITLQEFGRSEEHKARFLNDPERAYLRIWRGTV